MPKAPLANPIVFTAEEDDTTLPDDLDIYARGLWGGVVVFGNAVLNGTIDAGGNAQPLGSKYEVYEGLPDLELEGQNVFRFGGNDDNDNSGVLRYVSIRHGGAVLAPNKEINGLSLGAVGRGTTVEYVEALRHGGRRVRVLRRHGQHQALGQLLQRRRFVRRGHGLPRDQPVLVRHSGPDKRNYGMELNNHPSELSQAEALTPPRISRSTT